MVSRAKLRLSYCLDIGRSLPFGTVQLRSLWPILAAPADSVLLHHASFGPVADIPNLPRVLLLGDSISMGYTIPVRTQLKGIANVHRPQENCSHTRFALNRLEDWLRGGKWDAIHFNFGLHDISLDGDRQVVPPQEYANNLIALVGRLKRTGAALAWASTTPVLRDLSCKDPVRGNTFTQRSKDVDVYNEIAAEIMAANDVPVDDLNGLSKARITELQIPDDIHFCRQGYAFLGATVAGFLRRRLTSR
jgi:acyl-CoA thioesterase-1